jgi:hypothetical protein
LCLSSAFFNEHLTSRPNPISLPNLKTTFPLQQKEKSMQYKTIILHLLEQRPEIQDQLQSNKTMMPTLDRFSRELQDRHQSWVATLSQSGECCDESQVANEALEFALEEILGSLQREFPSAADELTLDGAMEFLRRHTPPA